MSIQDFIQYFYSILGLKCQKIENAWKKIENESIRWRYSKLQKENKAIVLHGREFCAT